MTVSIPKSIRELASDHGVPEARTLGNAGKIVIGCGLALAIFVPLDGASARGFNVLYTFTGGNDGGNPYATLIDMKSNRYGTTYAGGMNNAGTVFRLAPDGTETALYSFTGGSDGGNPLAERLIKDAAGNLARVRRSPVARITAALSSGSCAGRHRNCAPRIHRRQRWQQSLRRVDREQEGRSLRHDARRWCE